MVNLTSDEVVKLIASEVFHDAVPGKPLAEKSKMARIVSGHAKEDNWVDIAGYAALGGEI